MSWQDVLKVLTPRMFLENIQTVIGGQIEGSSMRSGDRYYLDSDRGKVTVARKGSSAYNIKFEDFNMNDYNLSKVLPKLMDYINGEMEKVAEKYNNIDFLSKLKMIPQLLQKYVAINQSLYI